MSDYAKLMIEVLLGLLAVLLAYGITALVTARRGPVTDGSGHRQGESALRLAALVLAPLLVLVLTFPARQVLTRLAPDGRWLTDFPRHQQAWMTFWSIVLALGFLEFAWRGAYAWRRRSFPVPALIRNIVRSLLVVGVALAVAKWVLQRDISTALASTALLTAVIGFALQGVLGNLLAGMSMHIVRSIMPGDWVAIGDLEGEVVETNWRETRLRTLAGHMMLIPNSKVAESVIHNMRYPSPRRRHRVSVGASYSDAPAEVIEALLAAAASVPAVLREPAPTAFVDEYLDFGINYVLRFWTDRYHEHVSIDGDVKRMIWYQFKRRNIEIPFPMSDKLLNDFMEVVYRQRVQPPADSELERRVADLLRSDFCRSMLVDPQGHSLVSTDELRSIAGTCRHVHFTTGETIFRQGDNGDTAYVIVRGTVSGDVHYESAGEGSRFELGAGTLFGEMNLVTGQPRTATLSAATEVELLAIPAEAFTALLALRPEVPEKLAELISRRAAQNAAAYEKLKAEGRLQAGQPLHPRSILNRFRQLLGRQW